MLALFLTLLTQPVAAHHARIDGKQIAWSTVIAGQIARDERFELAQPLPLGFAIEATTDLEVERDAQGAIVALRATDHVTSIRLGMRGPLEPFAAPVLSKTAQRITFAAPARFVPAPSLALEGRLGYSASATIDSHARHAIDDAVAYFVEDPGPGALYLAGDAPLVGELRGSARSRGTAMMIGLGFAAVVAALFAAHKGLAKRAERERAEARLKADLDALVTEPSTTSTHASG